jgi:hypothetical protein
MIQAVAGKDSSVAASSRVLHRILSMSLLGGIVVLLAPGPSAPDGTSVKRVGRKPVLGPSMDEAPSEVREFLGRVLDRIPNGGAVITGYQFYHWEWKGRPTHEAVGLKAIPGVDPQKLVACVMNVDGYKGNIAHVEAARSEPDPAFNPPEKVRFFQVISIPKVARVQHELVLVDAGTVKGYRLVYWYLLKDKTSKLDPKLAARSAFNIGAWLVTPDVVGYALSSWPQRDDVNVLQWVSLTKGENALAKVIVERNIDGMAAWAKKQSEAGPTPR